MPSEAEPKKTLLVNYEVVDRAETSSKISEEMPQ